MGQELFSGLGDRPEINLTFPKYDAYKWKHDLWNPGVAYVVESLEGSQKMELSWILPLVSMSHIEKRPEELIHHLISDERQGSLSCFFKSKGWITSLVAFVGYDSDFSNVSDSTYSSTLAGQLFQISIDITDIGWQHRYDMVSYVYQYFNLLKTIDGYEPLSTHIKEVKSLTRMKFGCLDFDSEQLCDPSQFSLTLAVNMLKFPVIKAISLDFLYGFGDEKAFKEMLGKKVLYFNFNYKEESIPQYFLHQWKTSEDIDHALHLPPCNELMPTSFYEVLEGHLGHVEEENNDESYFERIGLKCFYKDDKGILSEASLNIYLNPG
ncbi:hypothetical protein HID58_070135, partial [Brassica napus]